MKKSSSDFSRDSLLRFFKSIIRPIMDYGDIIFEKPKMNHSKIKLRLSNIKYV